MFILAYNPKLSKLICYLFLALIFTSLQLNADLIFKNSTSVKQTGTVKFDTNSDGTDDIGFSSGNLVGLGTTTPNSTLEIAGSIGLQLQTISSNTTLSGNSFIIVDTSASGGNITITLPDATTMNGRKYFIKKINDSHTVTIAGNIDNSQDMSLTSSSNIQAYVELVASGTDWFILDVTTAAQVIGPFGPEILSIVADDSDNQDHTIDNGDLLTLTFDQSTNQPAASTKIEIDSLINFDGYLLGTDYTGSWTSSNTLVITVVDSTGATLPLSGNIVIKANGTPDLQNPLQSSDASTSSSTIIGDWGFNTELKEHIVYVQPNTHDFTTNASSSSQQKLFYFKLISNGIATSTISEFKLDISAINGFTNSNLANLSIYIDDNNDGAWDASETTSVGGAGNIDIDSNLRVTFNTSFSVSQSGNNYFLVGDILGIGSMPEGDVATLAMKPANVTSDITMIGIQLSTTIVIQNQQNLGSLTYGTTSSPSNTPRTRIFNGIENSWSSEAQMATGNSTIYWSQNSTNANGNIITMVLSDTGSGMSLEAQNLIGGTWNLDWSSTDMSDTHNSKRGFDVVHENLSGDVVVVYSNNTTTPVYRTYNYTTNTWSAETNVFGSAPGNVPIWVKLSSKPGDDEIQLTYMDSSSSLFTATWNGSSWGAAKLLETTLGSDTVNCFAGTYESLSGDFLIGWGKSGTSGLTYATRTSGNSTFSSNQTAIYGSDDSPRIIDCAADPASDRVAFVYRTNTNDFEAITWAGSGFADGKELDSDMGGNGNGDMTVGVAWLSTTNEAVAFYDDNNDTGKIHWATYSTSLGWTLKTDVTVGGVGAIESIKLYSYNDLNQVLAVFSDANNDLWSAIYDGTNWSLSNGSVALETNLSNVAGVPFATSTLPKPLLGIGNHKEGQEDNFFTGSSSFSTAQSFAFQLRPVSGNTFTVTNIRFDLSSLVGILTSDITDAVIRIDSDNDGVLDAGELTEVGGAETVNIIDSEGTIEFSSSFTVSSANNYFLLLDITNIASNDQLNIDLIPAGLTVTDAVAGGLVTPSTHVSGTTFSEFIDDVRISYGNSTTPEDIPSTRVYSFQNNELSAAYDTTNANSSVYWTRNHIDFSGNTEFLAVLSSAGSSMNLDLLRFDGNNWVNDWNDNDFDVSKINKRAFDMVAESLTGNVMVVYSNNAANPTFRYYDGSSWSAEADVFASVPTSGIVEWVELQAKPGTNEIALAFSDANSDLVSIFWNGSAWVESSEITHSTGIKTRAQQCWDIAYETLSGDFLVCWGDGGDGINHAFYTEATSSWDSSNNYVYINDNQARDMRLAADPSSDKIAIVFESHNNYLEAATWTGDGMSDGERLEYTHDALSNDGDRLIDVTFLGTTGKAIVIFKDETHATAIHWASWESGSGWTTEVDYTFPLIQDIESVKLVSLTNDNKALALLSDSSSSLYGAIYDNTTWTLLNGGDPLQSQLSRIDGVPFDAYVKQSSRLLLSDHKLSQKSSQFSGTGSLDDVEIHAFQLKPFVGSGNTVTRLVLTLQNVVGISQSDISSAQIVLDSNNDGDIDAGETTTLGGSGVVSISGATGNIVFSTNFTISSANNYIISANFINIATGDILGSTLPSSSLTTDGSVAVLGSTQDALHIVGSLEPSNSGDIRLLYGSSDSPGIKAKTRVWIESNDAYSPEFTTEDSSGSIYWIESAKSPIDNGEMFITHSVDSDKLDLDLIRWDGSTWSNDWNDNAVSSSQSYRIYSDIAYESISGNAIVVYSNWNSTIKYRHFTASTNTWSAETNVFSSVPITGTTRWVRLEAQPGTNQIALVYNDSNWDLAACIWDGTQWDETNTEITLDTNLEQWDLRQFDLAYESISGDLLVVWGRRDTDGIRHRTLPFNSTTWSSESNYTYTNDEEPRFSRLVPDPFSNKIAYGGYHDGGHLDLAMWTGTQWIDGRYRDYMYDGAWPRASYKLDLAWIGSTGQAIVVFDDQGETGVLNWLYWTDTSDGWQWKSETSIAGFDALNSAKLHSKMDENKAFAILSDETGQLFSLETDGSTWTVHESGTPITSSLAASEAVPFALQVTEPPVIIVSDHDNGQVENALSAGASIDDAEFYTFSLKQKRGTNKTVGKLVFSLTEISGIYTADFSDLGVYIDENNNGTLDAGDSTAVGGTGTASISGSSGNIVFETDFIISSANNYILRVDIANLVSNDQLTISLDSTGVVGSGETVTVGETLSAGHFKGDFTLSNVGDMRVLYGSSVAPSDKPRQRVWQESSDSWSPAESIISIGEVINFSEHAISSTNVNEEMAAIVYKTSSGVSGNILRWNGSTWSAEATWNNTYTNQYLHKGISVKYERLSGNCMVVYAENNNNPKYQYWDGSSWTSGSVFSSAPGTAVRYTEMASRPGSNEITLVIYDSSNDIHAIVWDGTQWDETNTKVTLETSGRYVNNRCFDLEYESITGDLLVAWGKGSPDGIHFTTRLADSNSWSATSTYTHSDDRDPLFLDLVADPNSNKIALACEEDDRWFHAAMWEGETFTDGKRIEYSWDGVTSNGHFYVKPVWIGKTGEAVCVYADNDNTGAIHWASYTTASGWTLENDISITGYGATGSMIGEYSYHQNKAIFISNDESLGLYSYHYDGTNWTFNNGGEKLGDTTTLTGVPYSIAMRQETAVIVSDHKNGITSDSFSEAGSETDAVISAFSLYPREAGSHTITQTVIDLTDINGVFTSDLTDLQIVIDSDEDGVIDAGETTVGGTGSVAISGTSGNIVFSTSYALSSRTQFLVSANIANLADKDTITTSLTEANMRASGNTVFFGSSSEAGHTEGVIKPNANGDLRLVWGTTESPADSPRSKVYDKDTELWSATATISGGNSPVYWMVNDIAPSGNQEIMASYSSDGTNRYLNVFSWNGATWAKDWSSSSMTATHDSRRGFDLVYNQISGNGLVVYSKNNSNLYYRTYSANVWSSEAVVYASAPGGTVHWVELVQRSGSDETALILSDVNRDLHAIMWDGSSWTEDGSGDSLETNTEDTTQKTFGAAFENLSGNLMVLWGKRDTGGFYTSIRDAGGTFGTPSVNTYANDNPARYVDLRSEPGSNRIAVAIKADDNQLELAIWDGSDFIDETQLNHMGWPGNGVFALAMDWVGTTGKVALVFDDNDDGAGLINWAIWDNGWSNQTDISMPLKDLTKGVLAQRVHNEDRVVFVIYDDVNNIFATSYDGTSMSIYNNSEALGTVSGPGTNMPFSFAMRSQQSIQLADHTDGQEQDAFGEATTETNAELFSFKLTPSSGVTPTITQLQFAISNITGLVDGDWTGLQVLIDENDDGKISGSENTSVGGAGVVNQGSGTITFSTSFTVSSANNYILSGNFTSLSTNDEVTIQLTPAGFTTQSGEETDGSTTAVTHYENRPAKLAEDDISLVYGTTSAPANDPRSRIWDDSSDDWDTVTQTSATNTSIKWTINKIDPLGQEELIAVLSDTTSASNLNILRWNGSSWVLDWNSTSITSSNSVKRGVDIAYEALSGNAMVVYSNNTSTPVYRVLSSGNWTAETNVLASAPGAGIVEWVELVRKPGDNEITLVYADSNNDLFSVVWNGSSWNEAGTEVTLTTTLTTRTEKCFDAAYETLTGDLIVAWGDTANEGPVYTTRLNASNSWATIQAYGYTNDSNPLVLTLSSDPASNKIAAAFHTDENDLEAALWNGSQWVNGTDLDNDIGAVSAGELSVGVEWIGTTETAVIIYNDNAAAADLHWATWTNLLGWVLQTDESIAGMGAINNVTLSSFTGSDKLMATLGDSNDDLWSLIYDGTTWEVTNSASALESNLTSSDSVPFSMTIRPKPILLFTDSVANQEADNFTESGSETGAELFSFQMKSKQESSQTISQLVFNLSDITGITASDITSAKIYIDENKDGTISGETTEVGGTGAVSITSETGTITFSTNISVGANTHYILKADVANLANEDELTLSLESSGFTMTGGALVVGSVENVTHLEFAVQPLADNDLRVFYGISNIPENNPRQRTYDISSSSWSIESLTASTNGSARWIEQEKSPNDTDEIATLLSDDGVNTYLDVLRWNGSTWTNEWSSSSIAYANIQKRGFDVAYEAISGNAMVVYSNNSNNPVYRIYHSGSWSAETNILGSATGGVVEWIQLTSRPGSDEIALVYSDANSDLFSIVWNGSSWDEAGSFSQLETTLSTINQQSFNARYETLTGDLLVVWGKSGVGGLTYNTYDHTGTWASNLNFVYVGDEVPEAVYMEADPNSDRIGLIIDASGGDLETAIWLGSSWSEAEEKDDGMGNSDNGDVRVAFSWVGSTGKAVFIYDDNDLTGLAKWGDYEEGQGWNINNAISIPGLSTIESVKMFGYQNSNKVHALISDSNFNLFSLEYDDSTGVWTVLNDGDALASTIHTTESVPFSASVNLQDTLLLASHQQNQETNSFSGSGSETNAELFSFKLMPHHGNVMMNLTQLQFNLSLITGLSDSDFNGIQLIEDTDTDGTIDAGESAVGGTGVVSIAGSTGTITFSSTVSLNSTTSYILSSNILNLVTGDTMTMDFTTSDITIASHQVLGSVPQTSHFEGASTVSPDDTNEIRLVYGSLNSPDSDPRTRVWDAASQSWSTVTFSTGSSGRKRALQHELSPTSSEELSAFYSDQGGSLIIDVARWDGAAWNLDISRTLNDNRHSDKRQFDINYESMSGDALFVYSDDGTTLYYQTRVAGVWSGEQTLYASAPNGAWPLFIQLVPQPGSNRIALVFCDSDNDLYSTIWDGTQWLETATEIEIDTSLESSYRENFQAAYESLSGDLVVCYGDNGGNDGFSIITMSGNTNTWSSVQRWRPAYGQNAYFMRVTPDPYSDHMSCIFKGNGTNIEVGIWNGEQMVDFNRLEYAADASDIGDMPVATAWIGSTGNSIFIYKDKEENDALSWAIHNTNASTYQYYQTIQSDVSIPGLGEVESIVAKSLYGESKIMVAVSNTSSDLFLLVFDGTNWTVTNGGSALETDLSATDNIPFDFAIRKPTMVQFGNHPNGMEPNAFTSTGSVSDAELFSFQLKPYAGGNQTIQEIVISLDDIVGVTDSDITNANLYLDEDGDGVVDAGEVTTYGGAGVVDGVVLGSSNIAFTTSFTLTGTTNLILQADLANLVAKDKMNVTLTTTGITAGANTEILGYVDNHQHIQHDFSLDAGQAKISYGSFDQHHDRGTRPKTQLWIESQDAWSQTIPTLDVDYATKHLIHKVHPTANEELMAVFVSDYVDNRWLHLMRWDGSTWQSDFSTYPGDWEQRYRRGFDLAYSQVSGNAMVVYTDNNSEIKYQSWDGSSWSGETEVYSGTPINASRVLAVELVEKPGSDELALVYTDSAGDLYVITWDGETWDTANAIEVETSIRTSQEKCFDAAYETLSGELLVAWGRNNVSGIYYATMDNNKTWSATQRYVYISNHQPEFLELVPDPSSNRIACVHNARDGQLHGAIWLGGSWSYGERLEYMGGGGTGDFVTAVEWVGTTGDLVGIYDDNTDVGAIHWFSWNSSDSWAIQSDISYPNMNYLESVMLRSNENGSRVLAAFLDRYRQLFTATYDGTSWTLLNDGEPLHQELSNHEGVPFDIVMKQSETLYLTDHSSGLKTNQITNSGAQANIHAFAFRLFPHSGQSETVNSLTVQLSDVSGILTSDISNAKIFVDTNSNGNIDVGETTEVGGAGSVLVSGSTGSITFSTSFANSGNTNYIMLLDLANINSADSIALSSSSSDLTLADTNALMTGDSSKNIHLFEPLQPDESGDIRIAYGTTQSPATSPRVRYIDETTEVVSAEEQPFSADETIYYTENRLAANSNIEVMAVFSKNTDATLTVASRSDSTWTTDWSTTSFNSTGHLRKAYDLELSAVSDNVMVVWGDDSNNILYRFKTSGSWTAQDDVLSTALHSGKIDWVELVPKPGTNQFALVYSDSNSDLFGVIWDGTQWLTATGITFETGLEIRNEKCFDAAYETLSGNLMVGWGKNGNSNHGIHYRILPNGSTSWNSKIRHTYSNDNSPRLMRFIPDPASNQIAYFGRAEGDHNEVGIWNGHTWFNSRRLDWMGNPGSSRFYLDGAWVGTTGEFVGVYNDYETQDVMNWVSYNTDYRWNNNWEVMIDNSVPGAGETISVDLETHLSQNKAIVSFSDIGQNLYLQSYDGIAWTNLNGTDPIEENLSSVTTHPFDLSIQNNRHLVIADHNNGQLFDQFSGNTTLTQAEMYKCKLIPARGTFSVTNLVFTIDDVDNKITADFANAKLFVDTNGDGTIGAGETTQIGGAGTVSISVGNANGTITFADDFTLDSTLELILKLDVANIATGDCISIQLQNTNITTTETKDVTGLVSKVLHRKGAYTIDDGGDAHLYFASYPEQSATLKARHFDLSTTTWSTQFLTAHASAPPLWVVAKKSPTHANEEIIACVSKLDQTLILEVFRFDGTEWIRDWVDTSYGDNYRNSRGFDLAYEKTSGHAVITYMEGQELQYRTWDGSSWSAEATVFSSKPNSSNIRWVEMSAHPSTDEITVAYLDNNRDLFSIKWDGSAWDEANTEKTHETDTRANHRRCFDLAYSQTSGNLLVAWGQRSNDRTEYMTRDNGSNTWSSATTYSYSNDNRAYWLELEPAPSSDNISMVLETQSNGEDLEAAVWTGSSFTGGKEIDGYIRGGYDGDAAVATSWVGDTGEAVIVYDDDDLKDAFRWAKWNGSSWSIQTNVDLVGMTGIESIKMVNAVDQDKLYLLIYDLTTKIYMFTYDGTSWVNTYISDSLIEQGTSDQTQPFDITVKGLLNE